VEDIRECVRGEFSVGARWYNWLQRPATKLDDAVRVERFSPLQKKWKTEHVFSRVGGTTGSIEICAAAIH
jgi:hypothetical protein